MAGRPIKRRIDYAGWSVDMFDVDKKIDKLLDSQGWVGFGIYFFLCQRAYGSDGYFYRWSYDDAATTARKMGGGVGSETVKQTVGLCLQIGLFDNRLFVEGGILTSRGIQKRYYAVIADRPGKAVIGDFWLLSDDETTGLNKLARNSNLSPINGNLSPSNTDYAPLKESKGNRKESKGEGIGADKPPSTRTPFIPPTLDQVADYCRERGKGVNPERWHDHYCSNGWMVGKTKMVDWKAAVRKWENNNYDRKPNSKPQRGNPNPDYTGGDSFV